MPVIPTAATAYVTAAALASTPGPLSVPRYAYVVELDRTFQWVAGDTTTTDNVNVIGSSGGGAGRWKRIASAHTGDALTDANAVILVSGNEVRPIPLARLTANRTGTLSTTGALEGYRVRIIRYDVGAFTYTVVNGGPLAGTLVTMPVSVRAWGDFLFNGTDWLHVASGLAL